jgi:hypothetical protein
MALVRAAERVLAGAHTEAARIVEDALSDTPPGNAAWLLSVEPLLQAADHADAWAGALALVRRRAV